MRVHRALFVAPMLVLCCGFNLNAEDLFGAVAYSQSTRHAGWVWGHETREQAEAAALKKCDRRDAAVVVWAKNSWISFSHGDGTSHGWGWDPNSEDAAKQTALTNCSNRAKGCHTVTTFYSGGKGKATILVLVPKNTRVFQGNYEIPIREGRGTFESPEVLGGKNYVYSLKATLNLDGTRIEQEKTMDVSAFKTTIFRFENLDLMSELGIPPVDVGELVDLPLLKP